MVNDLKDVDFPKESTPSQTFEAAKMVMFSPRFRWVRAGPVCYPFPHCCGGFLSSILGWSWGSAGGAQEMDPKNGVEQWGKDPGRESHGMFGKRER